MNHGIFFWRCSTNPRGLRFQCWSNWVTMARDRALGQWVSWLSRLPYDCWNLGSSNGATMGYPKSCKSWMTWMTIYVLQPWLADPPFCKETPNLFMDPSHRIWWDATTTAANPMKIGISFKTSLLWDKETWPFSASCNSNTSIVKLPRWHAAIWPTRREPLPVYINLLKSQCADVPIPKKHGACQGSILYHSIIFPENATFNQEKLVVF